MPCTESLRFADLFAGLGGFHIALSRLGHKCVFACDSNAQLRECYAQNFGLTPAGDLRQVHSSDIPAHDVLCAGFPCQPFSKAGEQRGTKCGLWGDLFSHHVLRVLKAHKPRFFLFENVANLERHDGGHTWTRMLNSLKECGYDVRTRVLSPHKFGIPQIRDRLFIVGSLDSLDDFNWPTEVEGEPDIRGILDEKPAEARPISERVEKCLTVWADFLARAPKRVELPSFPIWAMEFGATYPYTKYDSLWEAPLSKLRGRRGSLGSSLNCYFRSELIERVPSHARAESGAFPKWKQDFIRKNRTFYRDNHRWIKPWLPKVREFHSSMQKLEWNIKGGIRDIWQHVIQFRASGVRVKRSTYAPSLVAMTTTQVPIIAWERRYMTPKECCRLQSMDSLVHLPRTATGVYKALGNAVNAQLVQLIARALLAPTARKRATRTSAA